MNNYYKPSKQCFSLKMILPFQKLNIPLLCCTQPIPRNISLQQGTERYNHNSQHLYILMQDSAIRAACLSVPHLHVYLCLCLTCMSICVCASLACLSVINLLSNMTHLPVFFNVFEQFDANTLMNLL